MKHLYESILDDEENILNGNSIINDWIESHCNIYDRQFNKKDYFFTKNNKVHFNGDIIYINAAEDKDLPFEIDNDYLFEVGIVGCNFRKISGLPKKIDRLIIQNCTNLIYFSFFKKIMVNDLNLENCNYNSFKYIPKDIKSIICKDCINLKSLDGLLNCNKLYNLQLSNCISLNDNLIGCPKELTYLTIEKCINLKSLKGAPLKVTNFKCIHNTSLKNLEGGPQKTDNYLIDTCYLISSLKGIAKEVTDNLTCMYCERLKSLKYAEHIKTIYCTHCDLIDKNYIKDFLEKYKINIIYK